MQTFKTNAYTATYSIAGAVHSITIDEAFNSPSTLADMIAARHNLKWRDIGSYDGIFYRSGKPKAAFAIAWSIVRSQVHT